MQVWAIARARATIGGPSFESRTPCRNAAFHVIATLSLVRADTARTTEAAAGPRGQRRMVPAAPTAARNCRRDSAVDAVGPSGYPRLTGRSGLCFIGATWVTRPLRRRREPFCVLPPASLSVLPNVEDRAVRVDPTHGVLNVVVGLETLGRRDAFEDAGRCTRAMAADGEDARFSVREPDPQNGGAVGSLAQSADVVDEGWRRALRIGH